MAETGYPPLEERNALIGFSVGIGSSTLRVVPKKELLAISFPSWARQQLAAQLAPLPSPGRSVEFGEGQYLLWLGVGQLMSYSKDDPIGETRMAQQIAPAGNVTELSDGWIALELEGPDALERLDLIAMPDLAEGSFDVGEITSTVINHLRVLIWRQSPTRLVLLSPASSARSLVHRLREDLAQAPCQAGYAR